MPGPHFNSKRLKAAQNVRAEFAPGSVPRVGTRLFTLRLLPRTVEKNCGCRIPKPPAAAPLPYTVVQGLTKNMSQLADPLDPLGNDATNISWVETSGIQPGDTVTFIKPSDNQLFTSTVQNFITNGGNGRKYAITLIHNHMQTTGQAEVHLYI